MKSTGSENAPLNVAVAGLGWWGKAIIGMLKNSSKVRVVKAVDTVPAAGEWARSQGLEFTTDYAAVLADPNVGGVILCTPHTMHMEQVVAAAAAKKHVFCEKPLALTRRDALTEVEACKANGVVLAVGHEHRFKPALQDVLRMVKSGELGAIQTTEATLTFELRPLPADNWRLQKAESPGGTTMVALGIHGLDLCDSREWSGGKRAGQSALGGHPTRNTLAILSQFQERRQRGDLLRAGPAVFHPLCGVRHQGMGGDSRQGAPASAGRLVVDQRRARRSAADDRISGDVDRARQCGGLRRCRRGPRALSGDPRRDGRQHLRL